MAFEARDLLLVDEDLQVARMGEIGLGGEEGRGGDARIRPRRHVGERHRQQCAADAIADGRDLALAGRLLDDVEGFERTLAHIVGEILVLMAFVRIDP